MSVRLDTLTQTYSAEEPSVFIGGNTVATMPILVTTHPQGVENEVINEDYICRMNARGLWLLLTGQMQLDPVVIYLDDNDDVVFM